MKGKSKEKLLISAIGLFLIFAVMPGMAYATVPGTINYQGYLADSGGTALDGVTVQMIFRIYDHATESAGHLKWTENHITVSVTKGIFNVILGETNSLNSDYGTINGDRWLEIQVNYGGYDETLGPRQKLTGAAFAIKAGVAESVENVTASTTDPDNTFVGVYAGGSNTTGNHNTFIGNAAGGFNTEGVSNTFIGSSAGSQNTTGSNNVFLGKTAGLWNTTGHNNTFLGIGSGYNNTVGITNTFIGDMAGNKNTEGDYNTFIGGSAGLWNTTGNENTVIGHQAGYGQNPGSQADRNTFVGYGTGFNTTTGGHNTFLGTYAGFLNTTGTNNIFIGYQAGYNETGSNKLYIDNSTTSTPLIYGDFFADELTVNGSLTVTNLSGLYDHNVYCDTSGKLTAPTSDRRLKINIKNIEDGLEIFKKLQGVRFNWKEQPEGKTRIGLIAQDAEKVIPELTFTNPTDGYMGINYSEITAVLIEAVKDQQKIIDELKKSKTAEIESLRNQLSHLQTLVETVMARQTEFKDNNDWLSMIR